VQSEGGWLASRVKFLFSRLGFQQICIANVDVCVCVMMMVVVAVGLCGRGRIAKVLFGYGFATLCPVITRQCQWQP
jgi:hypothetical protein